MSFKKILVAVDYSDCSRVALEYAAELAAKFGAELKIVHAWDRPHYARDDEIIVAHSGGTKKTLGDVLKETAEEDMKLFFGSCTLPKELKVEHEVRHGHVVTALIDACRSRGAAFISDEIYHGIEYEKKAVTALEISDAVYVINSFSKYFSMTGWRIGWMVVPADHVRTIERLTQNMYVCAPHVSQIAALAALDCEEELQANLEVYRQNRALLLKGLPEAGFTRIAPPDGAFYIYADVSEITDDSRALADDILQKAGVALTPGLDFDPVRGAGTLRFSYAQSTERIREGLARLADFMAQRG